MNFSHIVICPSIQSHTIYRTTTEALFSVLNDLKFPTAASKYHQAKREHLVIFENLVGLSFDYRAALIKLEEVESKISNSEGFKLKKLQVKKDQLQFKLMWMRKDGQERIRELKMWAQARTDLTECEKRNIKLPANLVERSKRLLKGA